MAVCFFSCAKCSDILGSLRRRSMYRFFSNDLLHKTRRLYLIACTVWIMGDGFATYSGHLFLPLCFLWYVHTHFDFYEASENGAWSLFSDDEWGMMPDVLLTTMSCPCSPCCYTGLLYLWLHILHVFVSHIIRQDSRWYWHMGYGFVFRLWARTGNRSDLLSYLVAYVYSKD